MADVDLDAAIAVTRFGLGAKAGEIEQAKRDPRGYLKAQIRTEGADQPQQGGESAKQRIGEFRDYRADKKATKQARAEGDAEKSAGDRDPVKRAQRMLREETGGDFVARARLATETSAGFRERWALFWANHFTVSAIKLATATVVGPFEQEAIRPNVFGKFADLLGAAEAHPAMLLYLDQAQSVGPHSWLAEKIGERTNRARGVGQSGPALPRKIPGLNENLAREILELHTVGVDGGYSQADVSEFARAMTGLSLGGPQDPESAYGASVFRNIAHEPGERTVMGRHYRAGGKEQAGAILADLAAMPQTARHISHKIARHFISDTPPQSLVDRLTDVWLSSDGNLTRVAAALIDAPESWDPIPAKFKTPYEFIISSCRACDAPAPDIRQLAPTLTSLGQKPFAAPSPKGWPEETEAWAAPDAIVKRMVWAQRFSQSLPGDRDPKSIAVQALGARLRPATATAIARAESRAEGLALLLMSPEFQRR